MNKSLITNIIAGFFTIVGFSTEINELFIIGLFALSGALTNWIAVHMLFEKVPFLYGSGVITEKFAEFKSAIYTLMMEEFFTKENIDRLFQSELSSNDAQFDFQDLIEETDFTPAYTSLKASVMESSLGGTLAMFGGEKILEPLKDPFTKKLKVAINEIIHTPSFQTLLKEKFSSSNISDDILEKVSSIVNARLDELTPQMVKEIIQKMIKEHLGWLVVWGGVFGGLIGFISSIAFI